MNTLASRYPSKGQDQLTTLSDFHSFKQALNVSSADQRLLVYATGPKDQITTAKSSLQAIFAHPSISGRFFFDIAGEQDTHWHKDIKNVSQKIGIFIIQSDKYGQSGTSLITLPLSSSPEALKKALITANSNFANTEKRKIYSEHVASGRKEDIYFQNTMPQGEDRDADGKIDSKRLRKKTSK